MWNRIFKSKSKENRTKKTKLSKHLSFGSSASKNGGSGIDDVSPTSPTGGSESEVLSETDELADQQQTEDLELKPCPTCTRTFLQPALLKHMNICEKMTVQKRTPFDSFRQRREGTELATYLPSDYGLIKQRSPSLHREPPRTKSKASAIDATSTTTKALRTAPKIERTNKLATSSLTRDSATRVSKRNQGPTAELCPHCERSFGIKAYDRHVEWCKEKSRLTTNSSLTAQQHLAKERLQARTAYKAPNLRSKREKNREKYSSMSESMNNLSDGGSYMDFRSVADPYERERKHSIMSLSMTSSVPSESGLSDKYDPFMSAKRQLEDLFSPTTPYATSTPLKETPTSSMTRSMTTAKTPPSPKKFVNTSSFRRTSSLRAPKRSPPKPISYMPTYKPTIQRGISDEGPISSNFMKPEEFDELPVKSHAIITPDLVPKSPALALRTPHSPSMVVKRAQNTTANRRNLCLDLKAPSEFQLSKTDSLAAFLKYENDLNCLSSEMDSTQQSAASPVKLSEKELKDKSNSLNKRTFSRSSFAELLDSKIDSSADPDITTDNIEKPCEQILSSNYVKSAKFAPSDKSALDGPTKHQYGYGDEDRIEESVRSIDSQLINSCDNLRMSNLSKLLPESLSASSLESNETTKHMGIDVLKNTSAESGDVNKYSPEITAASDDQFSLSLQSNKEMESVNWVSDKRNPKRQLQLRKNHLLFDGLSGMLNEQDNRNADEVVADDDSNTKMMGKTESDECDERSTSNSLAASARTPRDKDTKNDDGSNKVANTDIEALFDDFDLEEFISTFNDNEQFPIFKNFRDPSTSRSYSHSNNNSSDGSSDEGTSIVEEIKHNRSPSNSGRDDDITKTIDDFYGEESMPIKIPHSDNNNAKRKYSNHSIVEHHTVPEKDSPKIDRHVAENAPDVVRTDSQMALDAMTERDLQNNNLNRKYSDESPEQLIPVDENGMSQAERELLASVNELNRMCDSPKIGALDSTDDLASVDSYPFCSDSAYGSLFRESPIEKSTNAMSRLNHRSRQQSLLSYQMPEIIGMSSGRDVGGIRSTTNNTETLLPPLVTHAHKNNSQNIYDSINLSSITSMHGTTTKPTFNYNNNLNSFDKNGRSRAMPSNSIAGDRKPAPAATKHSLTNDAPPKMTKFCYECGAKFVVPHAKFCMECGVRRVVLE